MIDRVGDGSSYLVPPAREVAGADGRIDDGKLQAWTAKIRNEMEKIKLLDEQPGRHCIHSFSVRSASGVVANLDLALLNAIVFDSREQLARRWVGAAASEGVDGLHGLENVLMLAIEWGSREIVHHLLMSSLAAPPSAAAVGSGAPRRLSASSGAAEQAARYAELLASALQLALRKKHAPIVDLLLERDARPTGVDVFGLWADPAVTQFHRFSLDARARLLRGAEPPTPKRGMKLNTVQAVAVEAMQAHAKGDWNPATLHARRSSVATLAHVRAARERRASVERASHSRRARRPGRSRFRAGTATMPPPRPQSAPAYSIPLTSAPPLPPHRTTPQHRLRPGGPPTPARSSTQSPSF
jgi:hypothetical protein